MTLSPTNKKRTRNDFEYELIGTGPKGQRLSIDDITVQLIQHIQQSNELEQLGKPQSMTVGGIEGRSTLLRSPSPLPDANGKTQQERDWLVTVPQHDGSPNFMIFVAP